MKFLFFFLLIVMVIGAGGGWSMFLVPLYLLTGRITTFNRALKRIRKGHGKIVYLDGGGCLERLWFAESVPQTSWALRRSGTMVLSCCPNFDRVRTLAGGSFVEIHSEIAEFR